MKTLLISSIILVLIAMSPAFAHPHSNNVLIEHTHDPQTEITPLGDSLGLEKSIIPFHNPETNPLPWGFVEGKIANHAEGYPVVIQIFKDDEIVHFAQTTVDEYGNYEYKFRVQNSQDGKITKIFDGSYTVTVFKVVYLDVI